MIGLDTNVLVRYLTQDDPEQTRKANDFIERTIREGERLRVDVIVACEVVWVLMGPYGFDRDTVANTLDTMLDTERITFEDKDLVREATAQFRKGPGDFADYLLGIRNRRAGCDCTATFDRALRKHNAFRLL